MIGVPDEVRGEEVHAVLVPKQAPSSTATSSRLGQASAWPRSRCPGDLGVVPELPKTSTGKISKPPLREEFGHWAPAAAK